MTRGSWAGLRLGSAARRSSRGHHAAAWHSRHCCIASWRLASRPWSRRDATGTGSAPAPRARKGTGSAAWSVVLRAALCSHRGPKHCPHPGLCGSRGTLAATEDPRCAPRYGGLAGRGKRAPRPPGSQQAVPCEEPSRGSRPLRRHEGGGDGQQGSGSPAIRTHAKGLPQLCSEGCGHSSGTKGDTR